MTRADVRARLDAEFDAWIPDARDDHAVTTDEIDTLSMALDDAIETCTETIEDE